MDIFIEKIVQRQKTMQDYLIITGVIILCLFVIVFIIPSIPFINTMPIFFDAGAIYGAYVLIKSRNLEFEYAVTNGELDIDKIIARSRRKRIFSASCKEFEILAKLKSSHYTQHIQNVSNKIKAVSSMDSPDVYFALLNYNGEKTVVFFEPDERMLNSFKMFIPRKIFV